METEKDWEALGRYTDAKERMKKYRHQRKLAAIELLGFINNLIYETPENKIYRLNPLDANVVWDAVKEAEKHLMQAIDDMEKYAGRANKSVPIRVEGRTI